MKFAICFSGSIRDFPTCFPSLKRYVLNNLNADIFLHLWKMEDMSKLDASVNFKWKKDLCNEQYVIDQLKPVRHVIDKYSKEWEDKIISESGVDIARLNDLKLKSYGINACGMYYKIMKSFELMEDYCQTTGTKYDIVIRARLDFIWEDHILPTHFSTADDNRIFLIKDRYATHSRLPNNDKFFGGTFNAMGKMCRLFNHIGSYQKMLPLMDGQTLNQIHIKMCPLQIVWIGHQYTYYKCMGRHCIKNNGRKVVIDNNDQLEDFWYNLAYTLLYDGYNVVYLNQPVESSLNFNVLRAFRNFKLDGTPDLNKAFCYMGSEPKDGITINQIIINSNNPVQKNKVTFINTGGNISTAQLRDFVMSIIAIGKYGTVYHFEKAVPIYNVDIGENVIYKYLDHGYYHSKILACDDAHKKYKISFDRKHIFSNQPREIFKIVNLPKYIDRLEKNCMPANLPIIK